MIRRFVRSEKGNLSVILSVSLLPLVMAVAGGVDLVSMTRKISQLQNSLDSAALEIGTKYYSGMSNSELQTTGRNVFLANMVGAKGALDLEYESSTFEASAAPAGIEHHILVRSSIKQESMIGWSWEWKATRESVARVWPGMPACVLALDNHAASAIKIQGSTDVNLTGCVIAANSDSSTAVTRGGTAKMSAECVLTSGRTSGIASNSNATLACGKPLEDQYRSTDPLANISPPTLGNCQNIPSGKTVSLSPGTFCNKVLSGQVTMAAGVYIFSGGAVSLNGNDSLVGSGVTIFLLNGATFTTNGNQLLQLSPPTTGPYAGITIYAAKGNTAMVQINGTSDSTISGFVYAPSAHIFYAGNSATTAPGQCLRVIGNTIEMTGNAKIKSDCTAELGGRVMPAGRKISLYR